MNMQLPFPARRWLAPITIAASAVLLAACGGGGSATGSGIDAGVRTPQSYAAGRIAGFGSVIVGGVRYDDSRAEIEDDDDDATHDRSELKLGMVVEITSGAVSVGAGGETATASQIVVRSEIKGPVEAVDPAGGRLTVLGQTVQVDSATVFEDGDGLATLAAGDLVEVYAVTDASGQWLATRIEAEDALDAYKLRGRVSALDEAAATFRIGDALISYAGVPPSERPALANGMPVKLRLATTQQAGAWVALAIRSGERRVEDSAEAEAQGLVSDFVSLANFRVGGVRVDASGAGLEVEGGLLTAIANGVRVEVEGEIRDGVLVVGKLHFEDGEDDSGEIELHGTIEAFDAGARTLVVRGVSVHLGDGVVFEDGSAEALAVGVAVEVKGQLASGGTVVEALRIDFED